MADTEPQPGPPVVEIPPTLPVKKKRKWFRRTVAGLAVVIAILVMLVLFTPMLLSTDFAKAQLLSTVNARLNGRVEIRSISLGWTTGAKIAGVGLFDEHNTRIAAVENLDVPIPLWKAVFGKLKFGTVKVEQASIDLVYDEQGRSNFSKLNRQKVVPQSQTTTAGTVPADAPWPDLSGEIEFSRCTATVVRPNSPPLYISDLNGSVKIPDLNQPVDDRISANVRVGMQPPGAIKMAGRLALFKNRRVQPKSVEISQKFDATGIDVRAVAAFLPNDTAVEFVGGTADLQINAGYSGADGTHLHLTDSSMTVARLHVQTRATDGGPKTVIADDTITLAAAAEAAVGKDAVSVRVSKLSLSDTAGLFDIHKSGEDFFIGNPAGGSNGEITVNLNLEALDQIAVAFSGASDRVRLRSGKLAGSVTTTGGKVTGKFDLQNLAAGNSRPQAAVILLTAGTDAAGTDVVVDELSFNSAFAVVRLSQARLSLAAGTVWDKISKATIEANIPDLQTTTELLAAISPTISKPDGKAPANLRWTGGTASTAVHYSHTDAGIAVDCAVSSRVIGFRRGAQHYSAKPVDSLAKMTLTIGEGDTPLKQLRGVRVDTLIGNFGLATISMPVPITLTNLAAKPAAAGTVQVDGNLVDLCQLLTAWQGEASDTMPYTGSYSFVQRFSSADSGVTLDGKLAVKDFAVTGGGATSFNEGLIEVSNSISVTNGFDSVAMNSLTADMRTSRAFRLSVENGTIRDLQKSRQVHLPVECEYDLAKLWPVIHPMLTKSGQPDEYKDVQVAGHYTRIFAVDGSYPAGLPFKEAVKSLVASGEFAAEKVVYSGATVSNLAVPLTLNGGQLSTVYHDRSAGQNPAAPFNFNGGFGDLSEAMIDLTQTPPRLTLPRGKKLLKEVTLNPLLSQKLGKYINNPIFAGAESATGLVDVTATACDQFPLGELYKQRTPENTGRAEFEFSVRKLNIGLEGLTKLVKDFQKDSFEANINNGTVSFSGGMSTQHVAFVSGKYELDFDGTTRLSDGEFIPMRLTMPPAIWVEKSGLTRDPNVLKYLPAKFEVSLEGTISTLRPGRDTPNTVRDLLIKAGAKAATEQLLKGKPGDKKPGDPIGDLINGLGGKKKKK